VIIQRDRFGYGLTVSGDNPVYVLSVREGGAAHRAGINMNDQIIKVRLTVFHSTSLRERVLFDFVQDYQREK
jgi:Rho guanine nucleotide exchange factor 12